MLISIVFPILFIAAIFEIFTKGTHLLLSILLTIVAMPIIVVVHFSMLTTSNALNKEAKQLCDDSYKIKPDMDEFRGTYKITNNVTLDKVLKDTKTTLSDIIIATDSDENSVNDTNCININQYIYILKYIGRSVDNCNPNLLSNEIRLAETAYTRIGCAHLLLTVPLNNLTYFNAKSLEILIIFNVLKPREITNKSGDLITVKDIHMEKIMRKINAVKLSSLKEREFNKGATIGFFSSELQQIPADKTPRTKLPQETAVHLNQFIDRKWPANLLKLITYLMTRLKRGIIIPNLISLTIYTKHYLFEL